MTPATREHDQVRALAELLALEYAGAVAPGRVLGVVFRAHRALRLIHELSPARRLETTEAIARDQLTAQVSSRPRVVA